MSAVVTSSFEAIGTTISVAVTDESALVEATELVRDHVDTLDRAASRFRDDSELTRLHSRPGQPVEVSWLLFVALEEALGAAERTDGLVSPTMGEALELAGYDRDFSRVEPTGPPLRLRYRRVPGWRRLHLDRAARTVILPPGVKIDLGATAKAGCADRAALAAAALTESGVLVNLGGDLAVAGPSPEGGWVVRITDRTDAPPEAPGVTVAVAGGGLATSGTAARRWRRGDQVLHHIIDPVTGVPARSCWRTVTVVADTCLEANVASTAAVILGTAAPRWLGDRGLHARLLAEDGEAVAVGDWPLDALDAQAVGRVA